MDTRNKLSTLVVGTLAICFMWVNTQAFAAESPQRIIRINVPSHTLSIYEGDRDIADFKVAVGKSITPTPRGYFKVVEKIVNPTWIDPSDLKVVIPSGPQNPLGYRWIGFGGNYGIHGTIHPESIGHYASNGCVRMHESDVEKVFKLVTIGSPVQISYDRLVIKKLPSGEVVYYIYPDGYKLQPITTDKVVRALSGYGLADFINLNQIRYALKNPSAYQMHRVATPINLFYQDIKLDFKAVNYQNTIYLKLANLAKVARTKYDVVGNTVTTKYGSTQVYVFNNIYYIRLVDIRQIFPLEFGFNQDNNAGITFYSTERKDKFMGQQALAISVNPQTGILSKELVIDTTAKFANGVKKLK